MPLAYDVSMHIEARVPPDFYGEKTMNINTSTTPENMLADDVADLEESLYDFHLRMRDMIARHLWHGASREQRMTGLMIEALDNDLVELYRRAAAIQKHLR